VPFTLHVVPHRAEFVFSWKNLDFYSTIKFSVATLQFALHKFGEIKRVMKE